MENPWSSEILKYTPTNIEYYFTFAVAIRNIPLEKMKWLDEAHFMPFHLLKGKFVLILLK
jgi:hypothetical protein